MLRHWIGLAAVSAFLLAAHVLDADAYYRYTTISPPHCKTCHGDFRAPHYVSLRDGQGWGSSLHDVHSARVSDDCYVCHTAGAWNPVYIGKSTGGTGMDPIGCSGCHGRKRDGWGKMTMGYAFGHRMRHWNANRTVAGIPTRDCLRCHPDSDPNTIPASEWEIPPYYENPGTGHPDIPGDPCSPPPDRRENFAGGAAGLDNDGDGLFDMDDPDCAPGPLTPGEAAASPLPLLEVAACDRATGTITLTYGAACEATSHDIYFGPLEQVSTYAYAGAVCDIGTTGTHTFNPGPGSWFFLLVANNGSDEGSYGRRKAISNQIHERPPWSGNPCGRILDLSKRCD